MDQISRIKELVNKVLEDGIQLYDVSWQQEGNSRLLQIAIMHEDGSMDIDTCASMSEKISEKLDEEDFITNEYFLEVCSPGAERVLRNRDEMEAVIGEFVFVKLKNPKDGIAEVKGTLTSFVEHSIMLTYMDKAVKKKIEIDVENIALIRLSVKI